MAVSVVDGQLNPNPQPQSKPFKLKAKLLCAQLCCASPNMWILTLEKFLFGLSSPSGTSDQNWGAAAVRASSPVRVQLLPAGLPGAGLSFYILLNLCRLRVS